MDDAKEKAAEHLKKNAPTEVPGVGGLGHEIFKPRMNLKILERLSFKVDNKKRLIQLQ